MGWCKGCVGFGERERRTSGVEDICVIADDGGIRMGSTGGEVVLVVGRGVEEVGA